MKLDDFVLITKHGQLRIAPARTEAGSGLQYCDATDRIIGTITSLTPPTVTLMPLPGFPKTDAPLDSLRALYS